MEVLYYIKHTVVAVYAELWVGSSDIQNEQIIFPRLEIRKRRKVIVVIRRNVVYIFSFVLPCRFDEVNDKRVIEDFVIREMRTLIEHMDVPENQIAEAE